ncbi:BlaI/MecI/CopY family transcriptional regulator [Vagococcus fluvialis]|uniref:BlaI/MecI/CopY family transcriptional regulator n=1 Tax=Vagococcus fluvialis TaxID=2738 RepID=UPI00378E05D5
MIKLTKNERAVLEVFWASSSPMCIRDILAKDESLNKNTVPVIVRQLINKNLLEVAYIRKNEKALTQYFKTILDKEYFFQKELSKSDLKNLMVSFIDSSESTKELDSLEKLILEKRKKLNMEDK